MKKITPSLTTTIYVYSKHPKWGLGEIVGWTGCDTLDVAFEDGERRQLSYQYFHEEADVELCYVRLSDVGQLVNYLRERSVLYLVHFTHIDNLASIIKSGIIPRSFLADSYRASDDVRLDGNDEYSCFSLTYPNYLMLYQKRKKNPLSYILLMIDIEALSKINDESIVFYPGNAARSDMRFKGGHGISAIEAMFAENITTRDGTEIYRSAQRIESQYTTDPQAEVQIAASIPAKFIKKYMWKMI